MCVVFTDLDGTLLDHDTYAIEPALAALAELRARSIPVIFTTSKTRAETEMWRLRAGNTDPFVVENGGAIIDPPEVIEFGAPYATLVAALHAASAESGCRVRGFADCTAEEITASTALPLDQARLAMRREYDEPFTILDSGRQSALYAAIARRGFRLISGGRFHHILGDNDKADAVARLIERYGRPRTIGLGDSLNDVGFLRLVDHAIVIPSLFAHQLLDAVPGAVLASEPGPRGWSRAALDAIEQAGIQSNLSEERQKRG